MHEAKINIVWLNHFHHFTDEEWHDSFISYNLSPALINMALSAESTEATFCRADVLRSSALAAGGTTGSRARLRASLLHSVGGSGAAELVPLGPRSG